MKRNWLKIAFIGAMLIGLTSCKKEKHVFLFGNFEKDWISTFQQETSLSTQAVFTSLSMTSNEMYKIADTRSFAIQDGKKYMFEKQVQNSKMMILSIGFPDVEPFIKIDVKNHDFSYDTTLIEKQKELLIYNVFHTIDELRSIRSAVPIYLLGIWKNYNFEEPEEKLFNSFLNEINLALQESIIEQNVFYIPLNQIKTNQEAIQEVKRYIL